MSKETKRWIKIVIMLCIMFGFGFIPAPDPITQVGMRTLGVFIGTLFGWIFIEIGAPSVIGLIAMALLGSTGASETLTIVEI